MYATDGNAAIGKNAKVTSRAVGNSCPISCPLHPDNRQALVKSGEKQVDKCYAEATEQRFKSSRQNGLAGMISDRNRMRALLITAVAENKSLRIHERGDFMNGDKLDRDYIDDWAWACQSVLDMGMELPETWTYTHEYDSYILEKLSPYVKVYASIHSISDKRRAAKAGFKLFAWVDTAQKYTTKKKRGSKEKGNKSAPKRVEIDGEDFLVCPKQRLGNDRVTCTGCSKSTACKWCVTGKGNVLFIVH